MEANEKICPFCAETIKAAAIVCKHCGRELTPGKLEEKPAAKILPDIIVDASLLPLVPAIIFSVAAGVISGNIVIGGIVAVIGTIYVVGNAVGKRITVTNDKVIYKQGIMSFRTIEIHLDKLESIVLSKGIAGNLFGYGQLILGGGGITRTPSPQVSDPESLREEILARTESRKNKKF